jgi:Cu+-exporting ATPase
MFDRKGVTSMEKIKDCVCGAELEQGKSAASFDHQGKTYEFCSEECRDSFAENPNDFIK